MGVRDARQVQDGNDEEGHELQMLVFHSMITVRHCKNFTFLRLLPNSFHVKRVEAPTASFMKLKTRMRLSARLKKRSYGAVSAAVEFAEREMGERKGLSGQVIPFTLENRSWEDCMERVQSGGVLFGSL